MIHIFRLRRRVAMWCLVAAGIGCFGNTPAIGGGSGSEQSNEGARNLAGILAGAGIGVAATGFILGQSNIVVEEDGEYRQFESDPLLFTGVALFALGALIAALSAGGADDHESAESSIIDSDSDVAANSWAVSLSPGGNGGVGIGITRGF